MVDPHFGMAIMTILAIDPGPEKSSCVVWDDEAVIQSGELSNTAMLQQVDDWAHDGAVLAIEMVSSYGMPVGKDVFETVFWVGRFYQAWVPVIRQAPTLIYRTDVKMHLCQSMRAKDSNIRQALIDRFGAPGTKKNPGKLYGISKHLWSALAIAVTVADKAANIETKKLAL